MKKRAAHPAGNDVMAGSPEIDYFTLFDKYIDDDFEINACGQNGPSNGVIDEFEAEIGFKLPVAFHNYSRSIVGGNLRSRQRGNLAAAKTWGSSTFLVVLVRNDGRTGSPRKFRIGCTSGCKPKISSRKPRVIMFLS